MKRLVSIIILLILALIKSQGQCDPPTDPPAGSSPQSFCAIDDPTVADIVVTGTDIIWYDASTEGNVVLPETALVGGTAYYATQTIGGCESETRLAVTVNVSDPAAPTGSSSLSFCAIDNPVIADLTTATTGTAMRWYTSSTGGSALSPSTDLVNGTTYYASQTIDGCESDTRLAVAVTVTDPAPPTGNSVQSFCAIDDPAVADIVISATGTVTWYDEATGGDVVSSGTALENGVTYYASQTINGCESETRKAVTVSISDPPAPSANSPQSFCAIDYPVVADLTATGEAIRWYTSSTGGTALTLSTSLASGNYYASQTLGGCESDTRRAVTVNVSDPPAPSATSPQSFCAIDNPILADLTSTGTGIQWYTASTGGTVLAASTALVSGIYYASQTIDGCESDTRRAVTVVVSDPAAPSATSPQYFCAINNPIIADIAVTGTAIQWYTAATGGTVLSTSTALVSGSTYYASQTIAGCVSDTRRAVTVTVSDPAAPTGSSSLSFCAIDNPTIADLTTATTGTAMRWYASATGGTALSSSNDLVNGTTYYASQTIDGCESDTRFSVTVTVSDPPAPTGNSSQVFCGIDDPVVADLTATGTAIRWYSTSNGGSALSSSTSLFDGATYYASQTIDGCESDTRLSVEVTVSDPAAPFAATITQPTCTVATGTVELNGLPSSGTWTLLMSPGNITTTGTGASTSISDLEAGTYTFTVTNSLGCSSESSANVVINEQPPTPTIPVAGTITHPTCAVATGSVELSGLPAAGTWTITRNPGSITTTGTGTSTTLSGLPEGVYTFTVTNAPGCASESTGDFVINAQPPTPTVPVVGPITQPTCTVATGSVTINSLPSSGEWTLTRNPGQVTLTGTGASTTISGLETGTYTFTVTNTSGCTSAGPTDVVINVQPPTPTAPVIGTVTQPTYTVSTGRIGLTGLPATGTWTLTRIPGNITTTGTGTSTTVSGLAPGTYTFTVTNSFGCTSPSSANAVLNALKLYGSEGTLIYPNDTIKIEQPDSGSFSINVVSNTDWGVNDNSLWFKAVKIDDSTIEVTYMENISAVDKVAPFRVTYALNPQIVINLRHKARVSQLNESRFKNVKMYPNPAGDFVALDFGNEEFEKILLSITNIQGHIISAKEYNNLSPGSIIELVISGLPVGQYFIKIWDGISHKTFHLIKY